MNWRYRAVRSSDADASAGALGAVALIAMGAAPAVADDKANDTAAIALDVTGSGGSTAGSGSSGGDGSASSGGGTVGSSTSSATADSTPHSGDPASTGSGPVLPVAGAAAAAVGAGAVVVARRHRAARQSARRRDAQGQRSRSFAL